MVRVTLDLSEQQNEILSMVAAAQSKTKSQVLRQLIDVAKASLEAARVGQRLCICEGDRRVAVVIGA